jgi:hypothetical protein
MRPLHVHAGCVEALAEERALLAAFWTVHRPPSGVALALALRLLHALGASPAAAWAAAAQGGALYLLSHLLPQRSATAQGSSAGGAGEPVRAGPFNTLLLVRMVDSVHLGLSLLPSSDCFWQLADTCQLA